MEESDRKMLSALAGQVINDRLNRAYITDTVKGGRVKIELFGEPSEAEIKWVELQRYYERNK